MAVKRWNGTAWEVYAGSDLAPVKVTDGRVGKTTFIGATTPTGMVDGDIWIDQDTATNAVVPTALLAKGDIFVATANGAYTRLAAGNNGESLYADSSTSTGLRWQGDYNVGKNKILNGDFSIWQRGTTWSGTGYSGADRWYASLAGTTTMTQESTDLPSIPTIRYGVKWTTGAGASYGQLYQALEQNTVIPLRGKTITISGYVKISGTWIGSMYLNTDYNTSTDALLSQSTNNSSNAIGNAVDASSWKYWSVTTVIPSNAVGFRIGLIPDNAQSSGAVVRLAAIQMEIGNSSTTFTTNTGNQQAELAACQRYYWRTTAHPSSATTIMVAGMASSTNNIAQLYCAHPVTMRSTPTAAINTTNLQFWCAAGGGTGATPYGITQQGCSTTTGALNINAVGTPFTVNSVWSLLALGGATGYLEFSAEL